MSARIPYLELFLAESRERLLAARSLLPALDAELDAAALLELLRHAHSLKGMAATMGYDSMVELAHALEDLLDALSSRSDPQARALLPLLQSGLLTLGRIVDRVETGEDPASVPAEALAAELRRLLERPALPAASVPAPVLSADEPLWRVELLIDAAEPGRTVRVLGEAAAAGRFVRADPPRARIDGDGFEDRIGLVVASARSRASLEQALARIEGVRGVSVKPHAEPARAVRPSRQPVRWLRVRADRLDHLVERVLEARLDEARERAGVSDRRAGRSALLLREIHRGLLELRLVPFESVAHRLHRAVHELGRELGKDVDFRIAGAHVRLDRAVLDELLDPLLHLVRNALDHGLETPDERSAAGKPRRATLRLRLDRVGDRVLLSVEDDGRGLSAERLRRTAVTRGLIGAAEAEALSDEEALRLATLPGFSTAPEPGRISGRGVGLDLVRNSVERLGGTLEISSEPGAGARMRLVVPLSLALIPALIVRCGGETFAVPLAAIERVLRLERASAAAEGAAVESLELVPLAERLGLVAQPDPADPRPWILVVARGEARAGLVLDGVVGPREIVVRPFPAPLAMLPGYSGAALLEDGSIAPVLDPASL